MTKKFFDISSPKYASSKKESTILTYQGKKGTGPILKIGAILVILVTAGIFAYLALSKAEVEIWPKMENLNFKTEVKSGQEEAIPGKFFEEEKEASKEFLSTGILEKKDFARGKIRVNNNSQRPITLIKNTHFRSDEGKQFHSLKDITVPAKGYLDGVEVEADAAGNEYNVKPSKFSVPNLRKYSQELFYAVFAESFEPMKGGFLGNSPQVTEDDLKNAERILLEKLLAEGKESLKTTVSRDYIILEEAWKQEVVEKFPLAKAGQETNSFFFKAKIKSKVFAFKKSDLENFSKEFIFSQLQKNEKLLAQSLNLNYSIKEKDLDNGKITVNLEISAKAYQDIDPQILKEKIRKKSAVEGKIILEGEKEIFEAEIKLWPFWVKKVPQNDQKIKIKLNLD